jgi:hypothetical protein
MSPLIVPRNQTAKLKPVKTVADAGGDAAEAAASKGSPVLEEVRAILKDEGEKS